MRDTLLEHPEQEIQVKTMPPNCGDTSRLPKNGLEVSMIWHTLAGDPIFCLLVPTLLLDRGDNFGPPLKWIRSINNMLHPRMRPSFPLASPDITSPL